MITSCGTRVAPSEGRGNLALPILRPVAAHLVLTAIWLLALAQELAASPDPTQPRSYFERLSVEDLCRIRFEIPPPPGALPAPPTPCESREDEGRIPVGSETPIGGLTYVQYEFDHDMDRIDFRVVVRSFPRGADVYLQLYQSQIGSEGFYFGLQSRVRERDYLLIFSKWLDDEEAARIMKISRFAPCRTIGRLPYRNRVLIYKKFIERFPRGRRALERHLRGSVKINDQDGGFFQISAHEGPFAGVRLPDFPLQVGDTLDFSLVRDHTDETGTWYRYGVSREGDGRQWWVGSLRFETDAWIRRQGVGWTELFGTLVPRVARDDSCQYYDDLPRLWFLIDPARQYVGKVGVSTSYGSHNDSSVPQQDVVIDEETGKVEVRIGPEVERTHPARSWNWVRAAAAARRQGGGRTTA